MTGPKPWSWTSGPEAAASPSRSPWSIPQRDIYATDISPAALAVARANAARHGADADSLHGRRVSRRRAAPRRPHRDQSPVRRQTRTGAASHRKSGTTNRRWRSSGATMGSTQSRRLSNSAVARCSRRSPDHGNRLRPGRSGCRNRWSVPDLVLEEIRADLQGIPRVAVLRRA